MSYFKIVFVHLNRDSWFTCRLCSKLNEHPPFMLEYYRIGYGYCEACGRWLPFENGDALGIVKLNDKGELYTTLYPSKEGEENES